MKHNPNKFRKASLNHTFRLVWSEARQMFVAVAETCRSRGKLKSSVAGSVAAVLMGMAGTSVYALDPGALPSGGQVTAGNAAISSAGNTMNIDQSSQRAAINWQSFNVGSAATVNFNQPNASAVTLNRVVGNERSVIDGAINANGNVWILNSAGVLFNRSAQVNVGGLVASALDISDADFMAGKSTFESNGASGSIINLGTLSAASEGHIALLGQHVVNEGVIHATLGSAILAAGDKITLNFNGNSVVGVTIDRGALDALVENHQAIIADGGLVTLTAKGLDEVMRTVVNNTGEVRAMTIANQAGRIFLLGGMENDRIEVAGKLDASAPNGGDGGFIETSAARVVMHEGRVVTTLAAHGQTGTFLIDPNDFNIGANVGNGASADITAAQLSIDLGTNNVTISTATQGASGGNGDIFVNDPVSWSAPTKLTLIAERNIRINENITIGHQNGGLALHYGQGAPASGNTADYYLTGSVNTNVDDYFYSTWPGNIVFSNGGVFGEKKGSDGGLISYHFRDSAFVTSKVTSYVDDDADGWSGDNLGVFSTEVLPGDGHMIVLQPKDRTEILDSNGDFVAYVNNIDSIGTLFGIKQESIDYLNSPAIFDADTYNFSVVYRDISLAAGQSVTMSWNYVGMDYVPFNDASFLSFVNTTNASDATSTIAGLNTEVLVLGATNPGSGNWSTGSYRSTGWQTTSMVAGQAGVYRIGFAVFNLGDEQLSPYLAVDVVPGTTTLNGTPFAPIPIDPNGPIARGVGTSTPVVPSPPPSVVVPSNESPSTWSGLPPEQHRELEGAVNGVQNVNNLIVPPAPVPPGGVPPLLLGAQGVSPNVVAPSPGVLNLLGGSDNLLLISTPGAQEPTAPVTLSEARALLGLGQGAGEGTGAEGDSGEGEGQSGGERRVRVPASRNSLVDIVDGGQRLPNGVEQQLFVVSK